MKRYIHTALEGVSRLSRKAATLAHAHHCETTIFQKHCYSKGGSRLCLVMASTVGVPTPVCVCACYRTCVFRWNEKFDFIDVRAGSILLATVWDQATIIDAATSLKISRVSYVLLAPYEPQSVWQCMATSPFVLCLPVVYCWQLLVLAHLELREHKYTSWVECTQVLFSCDFNFAGSFQRPGVRTREDSNHGCGQCWSHPQTVSGVRSRFEMEG